MGERFRSRYESREVEFEFRTGEGATGAVWWIIPNDGTPERPISAREVRFAVGDSEAVLAEEIRVLDAKIDSVRDKLAKRPAGRIDRKFLAELNANITDILLATNLEDYDTPLRLGANGEIVQETREA